MLVVNVIIKLSSRIPTDREEERDETKLSAIWERRVLRSPTARVTEQQMKACRANTEPVEGRRSHAALESIDAHSSALKWNAGSHQNCQLWGLTPTVQRKTQGCWRKGNQGFSWKNQDLIGSYQVKYQELFFIPNSSVVGVINYVNLFCFEGLDCILFLSFSSALGGKLSRNAFAGPFRLSHFNDWLNFKYVI